MTNLTRVLVGTVFLSILAGCGPTGEVKRLDERFRAATEAGNAEEAHAVLGQIEVRGLASQSSIRPAEKAECYLAYAEGVFPEDYERALRTAEMARQVLQQIEQSGEPVPPALEQRFASLYRKLVAAAPQNMPRPEFQKVAFSEDFPETLVVDRTRPLDTQILELLMTEGLSRLEGRNRNLEEQNRLLEEQNLELRDRVEDLTGPITDLDQRLDQVATRLERLGATDTTDIGRLETNMAQIAEDMRALGADLGATVNDLEALRGAQGATAAEVKQVQDRLTGIVARAAEIGSQIDRMDARVARFEQAVMIGNLFRDGASAYSRGDIQVAVENLTAYLARAPEEDPNVAEATAIMGIIGMEKVGDIVARADWKVSKRDIEDARKTLEEAKKLLSAAQERVEDISAERLRESVKRQLSRVDDFERQLARR